MSERPSKAELQRHVQAIKREASRVTAADVLRHRRAAKQLMVEQALETADDALIGVTQPPEHGQDFLPKRHQLVAALLFEPVGHQAPQQKVIEDLAQIVIRLAREQFGIDLVVRHVGLPQGMLAQDGRTRP